MKDFLDRLIEAATTRQIVTEGDNLAAIDMFHDALRKNFSEMIEFLKQRGMNEADAYELMGFACGYEEIMSKNYAGYLRRFEKKRS